MTALIVTALSRTLPLPPLFNLSFLSTRSLQLQPAARGHLVIPRRRVRLLPPSDQPQPSGPLSPAPLPPSPPPPYDDEYTRRFYRHVEEGTGCRHQLGDITGPGGIAKGVRAMNWWG